jgi:hypothetical protein
MGSTLLARCAGIQTAAVPITTRMATVIIAESGSGRLAWSRKELRRADVRRPALRPGRLLRPQQSAARPISGTGCGLAISALPAPGVLRFRACARTAISRSRLVARTSQEL